MKYKNIIIYIILLYATYHRAPRYGDVRTWVENLLVRGEHALAEASKMMGYKINKKVYGGPQKCITFYIVVHSSPKETQLQFPDFLW